ncbi:MAG: HNH endonuclease, partial [Candidatus Gastranaerophilales bacterium]|nr:HNH endonuclease [Candidatus Gastranaerophilales bacterium]
MPQLWNSRLNDIKNLNEDIIYFKLEEQIQIAGSRIYVNSKNSIYKVLRQISLPNITYLAAIKLKNPNNNIIYYLRLFVDYFGETQNCNFVESQIKEIKESQTTSDEEKRQLTKARIGQGKYRQDLLELCPFCPITMVSDDRLLIASHIKPWAKSNKIEKIDPYNGFMFTPNIDLLFDRGFISFTDNKEMLVSPWLSKMTCSKLNIIPNKKYEFLPVKG